MDKRIVITGLGVVSSIGIGRDEFWSSLTKGESGISKITSFDTSEFPTHLGGEVKDFNPYRFVSKRRSSRIGRASALAIAGAKLALEDAEINLNDYERTRIGICVGTTMGETKILEKLNEDWFKRGADAIQPELISRYPCNVLSSNVAIELKSKGPNYVIPCACAAGNYSIGYAYDIIRADGADIMLAGGTDAFSRIAFIGFNRLFAIAPEKCQPFDKNRKGMMVAEGSGMVVLESYESALKRKAPIYAEILGYGLSCDAHHMTAPFSDGIKEAIQKAMKEAGIMLQEVDYLNAHGTGTLANDKEECLAIKKVFGDYYKKLPVSSIKSMLGHTMGAASAIEAIACCLALKYDLIPPTINYETPDPECDIDCVPNVSRKRKVDVVLNSSSAFGGNNACLVLKKLS